MYVRALLPDNGIFLFFLSLSAGNLSGSSAFARVARAGHLLYHEVFSRGDGSLIVSTVHEESAEDTETEPHDGNYSVYRRQDAYFCTCGKNDDSG